MVLSCSCHKLFRRRHTFLLLVALYLLVGIAFAAPANAEHLSHKRSHARKSIEVANANAKRASQRSVVDSRQQNKRALLGIDLPGLGAALGDDGTLLGVTLFPNITNTSASASNKASTSSSLSSNSTSSSPGTRTSSSSAVSTSVSSSTSPPAATPTPSASSSGGSQTPVPSPTSVSSTASPLPSSSCVGFLGIDLICTPITPPSSVTSNSGTAVHPTGPTSGGPSTVSDGVSTTPGGSTPTSVAPSSSSDDSCKGVISLDLLGNPLCVPPTKRPASSTSNPPASTSESSSGPAQDTSSIAQSSSSGDSNPPPSATDTGTTTCSGLLCGILPGPTSESNTAEPSSSNVPSATDTASTTCSGLLCGILPDPTSESSAADSSASATECTGLLCGILPTSSGTDLTASGSGSGLTSETSAPSATSGASSCSGLLCGITSDLPTITSAPPETTSAVPNESSAISGSATSGSSEALNSTTASVPVTTISEGNATSTSGVANATSTADSSIIFPTGNPTVSRTSSLITLTPTSEASVASQFSFLTQSSLLFSEVSSSSSSSLVTLTNPDEPTSSATLDSTVTGATVTSVPLPSGLPARIYPAEGGVTANTDLSDHTSVSILFDATLGWKFVATNTDSAAQLFAYFPNCLQVALGVSSDQIKTFALQVLETSEYKSPDDADELRTLFIAYIPSENVTALEQAIKAKQSDIYTKTTGISAQLAQRIDASYSVTSYPDPISENPDSSSSSGPSSSPNNSRRDAIIGVCSALGGIALCILGFLVYRNFKRRQETAHHRLGERQLDVGPAPGQDFDRDSIGGQRRRSFYYAEDSLRGYSQPPLREEVYAQHISPVPGSGGMRERRQVVPGTISAPILHDNTLNW